MRAGGRSFHEMKFSIITVCFNDLDRLKRTGASVVGQDHPAVEWIVIDGGSSEGTVDWLKTQDGVDWLSEPDEGLYQAMNKGIEMATGDYLIFMNAGDELATPTTLSDLEVAVFRSKSPIDFIYGDSIDVDDQGREFYRSARSHNSLWLGMFTQHQAMVFSRRVVDAGRYDVGYSLSADYAFVVECLRRATAQKAILRLAQPICRYSLTGLSTSRRLEAIKEDYRIRRELIGLNPFSAFGLFAFYLLHYTVKVRLPRLFTWLRY